MNPIPLVSESIKELWSWTYGIIAGWGLTLTIVIAALAFIYIKFYKLNKRVSNLENRLIHAERDYNLTLEKWKK